jgi:hypothetical protein
VGARPGHRCRRSRRPRPSSQPASLTARPNRAVALSSFNICRKQAHGTCASSPSCWFQHTRAYLGEADSSTLRRIDSGRRAQNGSALSSFYDMIQQLTPTSTPAAVRAEGAPAERAQSVIGRRLGPRLREQMAPLCFFPNGSFTPTRACCLAPVISYAGADRRFKRLSAQCRDSETDCMHETGDERRARMKAERRAKMAALRKMYAERLASNATGPRTRRQQVFGLGLYSASW